MCIHTRASLNVHVFMSGDYICILALICVYGCMCVCVCVHVCVCVCVCVCILALICVYACVIGWASKYMYSRQVLVYQNK